jgi:hypothetical protein
LPEVQEVVGMARLAIELGNDHAFKARPDMTASDAQAGLEMARRS